MTDYTYEVTDTGKYYYENNVRIFPEQFWQIIKKLEYENKELKKELALSKPLYSRRQLEKENEGLNAKNKVLYKEIERLKRQNKDLLYSNAKNMELLEKENGQLKADNNRLVNETARIVAEHQKKVLDLIDKSLEKDKQYYEMNYEDYLNGRIEALEELKEELMV